MVAHLAIPPLDGGWGLAGEAALATLQAVEGEIGSAVADALAERADPDLREERAEDLRAERNRAFLERLEVWPEGSPPLSQERFAIDMREGLECSGPEGGPYVNCLAFRANLRTDVAGDEVGILRAPGSDYRGTVHLFVRGDDGAWAPFSFHNVAEPTSLLDAVREGNLQPVAPRVLDLRIGGTVLKVKNRD